MESPPTPVTENGVKKTPDRTKSASTKKKSVSFDYNYYSGDSDSCD